MKTKTFFPFEKISRKKRNTLNTSGYWFLNVTRTFRRIFVRYQFRFIFNQHTHTNTLIHCTRIHIFKWVSNICQCKWWAEWVTFSMCGCYYILVGVFITLSLSFSQPYLDSLNMYFMCVWRQLYIIPSVCYHISNKHLYMYVCVCWNVVC